MDLEITLRTNDDAQISMADLETTTHLLTIPSKPGGKPSDCFLTFVGHFLTFISIVTLYH